MPPRPTGANIVDESGRVLGRNAGIHTMTIGQRKGLGIAAPEALYVVGIDHESRRVVVGSKDKLKCQGLVAGNVNWMEPTDETETLGEVQIRYRAPAIPCVIRKAANRTCEIRFAESFPAVTPGQAAVFYDGERVLGGGWIEKALH